MDGHSQQTDADEHEFPSHGFDHSQRSATCGPRAGSLARFSTRAYPHISDLYRLRGRLAVRPDLVTGGGRADNRVQPLLNESLAGGFRLPHVQVAQVPIVHDLRDMHDEALGWLIAESSNDFRIDVDADWYVLDPGKGHD